MVQHYALSSYALTCALLTLAWPSRPFRPLSVFQRCRFAVSPSRRCAGSVALPALRFVVSANTPLQQLCFPFLGPRLLTIPPRPVGRPWLQNDLACIAIQTQETSWRIPAPVRNVQAHQGMSG